MSDVQQRQVLDLTSQIARLTHDDMAASARDIALAARTIEKIVSPSAFGDSVKLAIRMAPHVPQANRVELVEDGRLVEGVQGIEILDQFGQRRIAKITVAGVVVLGQPEATIQR